MCYNGLEGPLLYQGNLTFEPVHLTMELPPLDQVEIALQAYRELQEELRGEDARPKVDAGESRPDLAQLLDEIGPLPHGTLLIGVAEDGLPILHNLHPEDADSASPILVTGEAGSGKTALLQTLAAGPDLGSDLSDIQFAVITNHPEEWTSLVSLPSALGVWPGYHPSSRHFLLQLANWAESLHRKRTSVLLLLDGLEVLADAGPEAQHDLRSLLMYGPQRGVWPVVAVNAARAAGMTSWLEHFQSRIFARIGDQALAASLTGDPGARLDDLLPGIQFGLQHPAGWLNFWIPALGAGRSDT